MRIRQEIREKIKLHIIEKILNGNMQSTEDMHSTEGIRKLIDRSWAMTRKLMQELYEEKRVDVQKNGRQRFWKVVE